jgi:hypothetical protein
MKRNTICISHTDEQVPEFAGIISIQALATAWFGRHRSYVVSRGVYSTAKMVCGTVTLHGRAVSGGNRSTNIIDLQDCSTQETF